MACCSMRQILPGGDVGEQAADRRLGVEHVHHDQGEAALAHVPQRLDEAAVEQRGERDDQGPGGQGGARAGG